MTRHPRALMMASLAVKGPDMFCEQQSEGGNKVSWPEQEVTNWAGIQMTRKEIRRLGHRAHLLEGSNLAEAIDEAQGKMDTRPDAVSYLLIRIVDGRL